MTEFREQDLTGARFERVSLRGSSFTQVYLNDARMHDVDLTGAQVRGALLGGCRLRGVELVDVEISEPGWPQEEDFPLKQCLRIVLNEEWEHRLYAERDLTLLEKED